MRFQILASSVGTFLAPLLISVSGWSATVVVPAGVEDALSSGLNTTVRNAARAYEEYFASSNFSSITQPVKITGMQFRLAVGENWRPVGYVGQTWPDVPISFGSYNVELSKPTAQLVADGEYLSISPTFASYQDGNLTTVRSGALNIAANSFLADGATPALSIHSFGPVISFSTPYTYTPGNGLVMLIRHLGYTGGALNAFFGSRDFANGVTDAISSTTSGTASVPDGFSSPVFVQFIYQPVPEPTTFSLLALVAMALCVRRRSR